MSDFELTNSDWNVVQNADYIDETDCDDVDSEPLQARMRAVTLANWDKFKQWDGEDDDRDALKDRGQSTGWNPGNGDEIPCKLYNFARMECDGFMPEGDYEPTDCSAGAIIGVLEKIAQDFDANEGLTVGAAARRFGAAAVRNPGVPQWALGLILIGGLMLVVLGMWTVFG